MALESQPISIANVENGVSPFVHRAWAWNSTGTDRFTLDYPNENLLRTTTSTATIVGMAQSNQTDARTNYTLNTTPFNTLWSDMKVGDTFTFSCDVTISGSGFAGQFRPQTSKDPYIALPPYYTITKAETVRVNFTGTVTQGLIDSSTVTMIQIRYDNVPTTVSITVSKPKLEKGSKATIYTPAPSEDFNNAYPTYEGVYSDTSVNGSTDPLKYTWTRMRGEDGVAGKDGRGITNTETMYAIHTSGTTPPTTGWTATVPALVKGSYLWTRNVWTYTDNTKETGYSVTYIAKDGNNGTDGIAGKDGVGIKSTTFSYATSTNGTTAPTTGWTTTVPTVTAGNYLWTRVVWTYTDNTTETGYSVARWGTNGTNGSNGVSVTGIQVEYAQTDTATEPSTGWSSTKPSPTVGKWYWTRTRNTLSNGTYTTWVVTVSFIGRDAVIISDTAPASPVKGTLWQTTTDPTVLEWNGSAWVIWGMSVDNIVADNLIAENGVFVKITGLEIEGGKITNPFNYWEGEFVDGTTDQLWYRGQTEIANNSTVTNWQSYNKRTDAVIKSGAFLSDMNGVSVHINDPSGVSQRASFKTDGILMADSRGMGNMTSSYLTYNDLVTTQPEGIPAASGFSQYATSGNNYPTGRRSGRTVTLSGAFKNNNVLPTDNTSYTIGNLPRHLRPISQVKIPQKGSGTTQYLLTIETTGEIKIQYRLGSVTGSGGGGYGYLSNNAGDIWNIHVSYPAQDLF